MLQRGGDGNEIEAFEVKQGWSFQRQARAFVDDLREDRVPLANGEDAVEDIRLAESIWKCLIK
jgi:predicted dehydrogenase